MAPKKKTTKKKPTNAEKDARKIINMSPEDKIEADKIKALFFQSKLKRLEALFDELQFGKGIARLQAEARIEVIEREMSDLQDSVVTLDWDIVASSEAKEA